MNPCKELFISAYVLKSQWIPVKNCGFQRMSWNPPKPNTSPTHHKHTFPKTRPDLSKKSPKDWEVNFWPQLPKNTSPTSKNTSPTSQKKKKWGGCTSVSRRLVAQEIPNQVHSTPRPRISIWADFQLSRSKNQGGCTSVSQRLVALETHTPNQHQSTGHPSISIHTKFRTDTTKRWRYMAS